VATLTRITKTEQGPHERDSGRVHQSAMLVRIPAKSLFDRLTNGAQEKLIRGTPLLLSYDGKPVSVSRHGKETSSSSLSGVFAMPVDARVNLRASPMMPSCRPPTNQDISKENSAVLPVGLAHLASRGLGMMLVRRLEALIRVTSVSWSHATYPLG
jgi:hypothetical protein